ncbi:MAG: DUF177 domain-containing protein [Rhizobiales bacterium]|nr:DUF177 domain-containing protein [Hyphomicrobiales bacterium]
MTRNDVPWSFVVGVAQIPETGLHQELKASDAQLGDLTALAGVRGIRDARATLDALPISGERVHVTGRVTAIVEQTCVVTLDPIETVVDEPIDVTFAPPSQISSTARVVAKEEGDDAEIPDPPDPIVNGTIDLGQLATEVLMLGIDPYPRKPGAVFESLEEARDPDEHPFAALKALKADHSAPKDKKTK